MSAQIIAHPARDLKAPVTTPMTAVELAQKVRELKELKLMAAELEAEIAAIENTIKAEMTPRALTS